MRVAIRLALLLLLISCSKKNALGPAGDIENTDAPPTRAVQLHLESADPLQLLFQGQEIIRLRALYADDGTPASNVPIEFRIEGPQSGLSLAAQTVTTGADGRAQNTVNAGIDKAEFTIVAGYGNQQLSLRVAVDGAYHGALRVRFDYDGAVPITSMTARLHAGASACNGHDIVASAPAVAERVVSNVSGALLFDTLEENTTFSVSAVALGPQGNVIAKGCIATPAVIGRDTIEVVLPLQALPIQLGTAYDFASRLHLHQGLPPSGRMAVEMLDAFFVSPGRAIKKAIIEVFAGLTGVDETSPEYQTSFMMSELMLDGASRLAFGRTFDEAFNHAFLDLTPAWVQSGVTISGDLTGLLTNMQVGGMMEFTNIDASNGTLQGRWQWSEFLFNWRYGQHCDQADACCGKWRYSGAAMGLAPMAAEITGTFSEAADSRQYALDIAPDRVQLEYGNIALYVLEHIVLQTLTGANTIEGSAESVLGCNGQACGCDRVSAWLQSFMRGPFGGQIVGQACQLAIAGIAQTIENRMREMNYSGEDDAHLNASFTALATDSDDDLVTDTLQGDVRGTWVVTLRTATFDGELDGVTHHPRCGAGRDCGQGEACQLFVDVLDACTGISACAASNATGRADAACTAETQCQSGYCMNAGQCLELCEQDSDCPTGWSCNTDATLNMSSGATAQVLMCGEISR